MAVADGVLSKIGEMNAGANAIFTFVSADAIATVAGANYFGTVAEDNNLRSGDVIIVVDNNTPTVDVIVINAVSHSAQTNTVVNGT